MNKLLKKGTYEVSTLSDPEQIKPNARFGTTFLDKKYKKYSVKDEAMVDKVTGEILFRRPTDGKIISFVQNNKYLHDIMIELRMLQENNLSFKFPTKEDSWFSSSDYNTFDIMGKQISALSGNSYTFDKSMSQMKDKFEFHISNSSNGFFIRPISRDTDRNLIAYLTRLYDATYERYIGDETEALIEKEKFKDPTWKYSNCSIQYDVTVTGIDTSDTNKTQTYSAINNITIDESNYVELPVDSFSFTFKEIKSIVVDITNVSFYKISFINKKINNTPDFDKTVYDNIKTPDNNVYIENVCVMAYEDDIIYVPMSENIVNVVLTDGFFTANYIGKVDKISSTGGFIVSAERPPYSKWTINNVWAESYRICRGNGEFERTDSETDWDDLEDYIHSSEGIVSTITTDPNDPNSFYAKTLFATEQDDDINKGGE